MPHTGLTFTRQAIDDFNRILITYKDGAAITFSDIGRVQDSVQEIRGATRLGLPGLTQGISAVAIQVRKQSGTNTVQIAQAVRTARPAKFS